MKHIRKALCVAFATLIAISMLSQETRQDEPLNNNENSTMELIRENTFQTARHTEKDKVDYTAFGISICAFVIAILTLHYSIRTYRSQKKTEQNTRRWSPYQERRNLRIIMYNLFCNYRKILAIEKMIAEGKRPAPTCFANMKINLDDLHLNEQYGICGYAQKELYDISLYLSRYNAMIDIRTAQAANKKYDWSKYKNNYANDIILFDKWEENFEEKRIIRLAIEAMARAYHWFLRATEDWKERQLSDKEKRELIINLTDMKKFDKLPRGIIDYLPVVQYYNQDYYGALGSCFDQCFSFIHTKTCDHYWEVSYLMYIARVNEKNENHMDVLKKKIETISTHPDCMEMYKQLQQYMKNPVNLWWNQMYTYDGLLPANLLVRLILMMLKVDSYGYDIEKIGDVLITE